jgi:cell wall-associated NlpC family hydrolase
LNANGFACLLAVAVSLAAAAPIGAAQQQYGSRAMGEGMHGKDVKTLQQYLTRAGFRASADGHFGPATVSAVRGWERSAERPANGRVSRREAGMIRDASEDAGSEPQRAEPAPAEPHGAAPSERAQVGPDGLAIAPASAPPEVKQVIEAGNEIAKKPYKYGGGHGRWKDSGYDCSGSVSYALHGAGLVRRPLDSTGFMSWGSRGKGEWITVYAHGGHAYMVVAGLRFDTSGLEQRGSRWTEARRSRAGYAVRHPNGF